MRSTATARKSKHLLLDQDKLKKAQRLLGAKTEAETIERALTLVISETEKDRRRKLRGNMPDAEVILWSKLQRRQLLGYKFRRQFSIGPYVMDFYCPALNLAIELDGDSRFREGAQQYDKQRQEYIESFGIAVVRFLNTDVYDNLDGVLEVIVREIGGREEVLPSVAKGRTRGGKP